ncbi:unnamed protein product [Candidula unifasciata]|uniref:Uncharacterized protein n=1 Tax=Candidula unifasciata TaxID=100452 RepID=A0A8S4A1H1_9EUPU|nr:unnamed protein product [Candidula unifasciata]
MLTGPAWHDITTTWHCRANLWTSGKNAIIGPLGRPPPIIPVTVVGESRVGKTSIIRHFKNRKFSSSYNPTFGVARTQIEVPTPNDICDPKVIFRFLDTNDVILDRKLATTVTDRLDSLMASFSRFILIVYDVTDHGSFEAARDWILVVKNMMEISTTIILVGNKCDQASKRQVHRTAGEVLALRHDMMFLETSAKEGNNLDHLLAYITAV